MKSKVEVLRERRTFTLPQVGHTRTELHGPFSIAVGIAHKISGTKLLENFSVTLKFVKISGWSDPGYAHAITGEEAAEVPNESSRIYIGASEFERNHTDGGIAEHFLAAAQDVKLMTFDVDF